MFGSLGAPELIIIGLIVVLLFGVGKISGLGREVGSSIKEFRKAVKDEDAEKETAPVAAPPQQQYVQQPQYAPAPQQYAQPQPQQYAPAPAPQYAPQPQQYAPAPAPQYAPPPQQYAPAPQQQYAPAPQPQYAPAPQPAPAPPPPPAQGGSSIF